MGFPASAIAYIRVVLIRLQPTLSRCLGQTKNTAWGRNVSPVLWRVDPGLGSTKEPGLQIAAFRPSPFSPFSPE